MIGGHLILIGKETKEAVMAYDIPAEFSVEIRMEYLLNKSQMLSYNKTN